MLWWQLKTVAIFYYIAKALVQAIMKNDEYAKDNLQLASKEFIELGSKRPLDS